MKKNLSFIFGVCAIALFTGCKSQESAYRQAYEKAMAQEKSGQNDQQTAPAETVTQAPTVNVAPPASRETEVDNSDVRTIQGGISVMKGNPLKTYSVVVGSFVTQANAEGLVSRLEGQGYDARVVKTNETINGKTGWFRVIASSYDDKASAVQSRNALRSSFPDAWLLLR